MKKFCLNVPPSKSLSVNGVKVCVPEGSSTFVDYRFIAPAGAALTFENKPGGGIEITSNPPLQLRKEPDEPHRRHTLTLKVGGDSVQDLLAALTEIQFEVSRGFEGPVVFGGATKGWHGNHVVDPAMDQDGYLAALQERRRRLVEKN